MKLLRMESFIQPKQNPGYALLLQQEIFTIFPVQSNTNCLLSIPNSTPITSTRHFHILILLPFHCILIGVQYYHPVFPISKSRFHICCIRTAFTVFFVVQLCSFHDVSSLCVFSFQFFYLCFIVFSALSLLHIRLLCASENFLLTYLLTVLVQKAQRQLCAKVQLLDEYNQARKYV